MADRLGRLLKRIFVGSAGYHQQCTIALRAPQTEVTVRLHGLGDPIDVTRTHMLACATPFTVGITGIEARERTRVTMTLHESRGRQRLLGTIGLELRGVLSSSGQDLYLFEIRNSRNYCLPRPRLWAHYLYYAGKRLWQPSEVRVTAKGSHAMGVFFICPRPVVLVTAGDCETSNIFPMNLMGPVGSGYFAFALTTGRAATLLIERSRCLALSAIPIEQEHLAYELARNHRKERVDWNQLPFPTKRSKAFDLPVPQFASSVTEIEVEAVRNMGSHTLFLAKILHEEHSSDDLNFFMVHGIYNTWRQRNQQ